jgi:hypothetical protein
MIILNRIRKIPIWRIALVAFAFWILYHLGVRAWELARIFSGHPGLELTQQQILDEYNNERDHSITPPIPRIIHQVFHNWTDFDNENIPEDYAAQRQTCIDANPDWDNRVR